MKRVRISSLALALALVAVGTVASAAVLQITQVVERAPELLVLVRTEPPVAEAGPSAPVFAATLGQAALPIKGRAAPLRPTDGLLLAVAVDVSASLGKDAFAAVQQQLAATLSVLPQPAAVALLTIGAQVHTLRPFGPPADSVSALRDLAASEPQTALYEGVIAAQAAASSAQRPEMLRRAVLLVTDALDDSGKGYSPDEVRQRVVAANVPLFALVIGPTRLPKAQAEAASVLAQIARASGGAAVQATSGNAGDGLQMLLKRAAEADVLTLDCARCERDGVPRPLQVNVQLAAEKASDVRDVRLYPGPATPKPPVTRSASDAASAVEAPASPAPGTGVHGGLDVRRLLDRWWWVPLLTLLALAGGGAWIYQRRKHKDDTVPGNPNGPGGQNEPTQPPTGPTQRGAATGERELTLDIAGTGRLQVRVGIKGLVIGRSGHADVTVQDDAEASNRHAALSLDDAVLVVRDLGSSNGTFLNGTRIVRPEPLHDRDVLIVGRTEIRVYFGRL